MSLQLGALLICIAVFAIGLYRNLNVGILLFAAAAAVGVGLANMPLDDVLAGFPVDLMILLVGVTFFFGIAQVNGTVDRLIDAALQRVGHRRALLPLAFFALTGAVASMGNPAAGLVVIPIGMNVANKQRVEPILMAVAMGTGMSAGGFAPTSTFGIIVAGTAESAAVILNPIVLFAVALAANLTLLISAHLLWGRALLGSNARAEAEKSAERTLIAAGIRAQSVRSGGSGGDSADVDAGSDRGSLAPMTMIQKITVLTLITLVVVVIGASVLDMNPDIGVLTFALASILILIDPASSKAGADKIDWATVLLVGGIITYVGVLQDIGTINMLGEYAASMSWPLLAALLLCLVAGLVSAFASTIGMLAVLVPLAVPLISSAGLPGWAMMCAIAVCASIVDTCPFSSSGATMIATTPDPHARPRLTKMLLRWGLSLVVVGPIAAIGLLIVPAMAL
ncbi:C4-dicarboxylate ABC transporter [Mycolicibacterium farcinogenes]|uniref:SLC13 family permease n=1 Tax=Mycolicibacterium farcinogenes TaxID=1802 RepID=UPI001C8D8C2C|nr:SLC13 family permease [Mycolicibacterium farcinogenes]QZH60893.1 C4-dicarboxylate ABC transporter [Mycolicibacterium farcinogenes]